MFSRLDVVVVSIHASAREATKRIWHKNKQTKVSIHASTREATSKKYINMDTEQFQFTPPHWRRLRRQTQRYCPCCFNSRLRAGGDSRPHSTNSRRQCFNSRLRAGGDAGAVRVKYQCSLFQFTPPRGRRRRVAITVREHISFQFTPPRGRRRCGGILVHHTQVSIHASAREATAAPVSVSTVPRGFQFTPPRGRRQKG